MPSGKTLLVTGASGQLGRRVVELLLEAGESRIIATTRTPDKLADFATRGVTVRVASFDDRASLEAAFAGADRLLLISTDAVGEPGKRLSQHQTAIAAAARAGVQHVVYTSLLNPVGTPISIAADHAGTEATLQASALGFTSLRNNMYADGLPQTIRQALALGGQLFSAAGDGKISYITREDCARAAAAALAADFNGRRVLDITGPEALSQADLAAIGSRLTGQAIQYIALPVAVMAENLVKVGLPQAIADLITSFDDAAAQGKLDTLSDAMQQLTGKPAARIADFLAEQLR